MRTALLFLFFCLHAKADDLRWEVTDLLQKFRSQVEAQLAALNLQLTQLKTDLTLEITELKSEVQKLKSKTAAPQPHCPTGWRKFGESCYYQSTEEMTWQQSRRYCQNQGADLVVINSREEQDFVAGLIQRYRSVWIGLTDRETEGVWKWLDGTPLTSPPTYWQSNEPNGGGSEDCAEIHNGELNDAPCGTSYYCMCEIVV